MATEQINIRAGETGSVRGTPLAALLVLASLVLMCSIYANLSFSVRDIADYRYFPPFEANVNYNKNDHLGAEYFNIALALRAGEGFADPFGEKTGPTAWMPPVLPAILAGLLWLCADCKEAVMVIVVCLQAAVLIGTAFLVLALARQTMGKLWAWAAAIAFFIGFVCDFYLWFQLTHDYWLVLLVLDLVLAGLCWLRPLATSGRAAAWGLFGGLAALVNPMAGVTWAVPTLLSARTRSAWRPLIVAGLCTLLAVAPWMVRNYLVFGKWIPVKSNLAYELYQSQCLEADGLVHLSTFDEHPYSGPGRERTAYKELGEPAYMEQKQQQFRLALYADPGKFIQQVGARLSAATLWYVPFWSEEPERLPCWVLFRRLTHPLPTLALLYLVANSFWRRLRPLQWLAISIHVVYLLPFIAISYYDRYGAPLLAVKVLLVLWALDRWLTTWRRLRPAAARTDCAVRPVRLAQVQVIEPTQPLYR